MNFSLLGPFEATIGGRRVELGRRRERLILAVLLLDAGRFIPLGRLADLIWDDAAPEGARAAMHTGVARLRGRLSPFGLELITRGDGYLIDVDPECVDVHRFSAIVSDARVAEEPDKRAALFADALAMWRGPLLADTANDRLRERIGGRLHELRLIAIEVRCAGPIRRCQRPLWARHRAVLPDRRRGEPRPHSQRLQLGPRPRGPPRGSHQQPRARVAVLHRRGQPPENGAGPQQRRVPLREARQVRAGARPLPAGRRPLPGGRGPGRRGGDVGQSGIHSPRDRPSRRGDRCLRRAVDLYRSLSARVAEAESLDLMGDNYRAAGAADDARAAWEAAARILDELDHPEAAQVTAKLREAPD